MPKAPAPDSQNTVRPRAWLAQAESRRYIKALYWIVIVFAIASLILFLTTWSVVNRKPVVLSKGTYGFTPVPLENFIIHRDDVEAYLSLVIPKLYDQQYDTKPAFRLLQGYVNPAIITQQEERYGEHLDQMKAQKATQWAIVNGVNPQTLVINRQRHFIYADVEGLVGINLANKSLSNPVQWQCLIYMTGNPGEGAGTNPWGLMLQQMAEVEPGTVNAQAPKPGPEDEQERAQEDAAAAQSQIDKPTLNNVVPSTNTGNGQ